MSKRPCQCGTCNRCVLFETNREINLLWGGDGTVRPLQPGEQRRKGETTAAPPLPRACARLGLPLTEDEKADRDLYQLRDWRWCEHADRPRGEAVCTCVGCGPTCRGYSPPTPATTAVPLTVGGGR